MQAASIKITNLHYFEALEQLALSNLPQFQHKPKLLQLPFYNLVCQFVDILTEFSKLPHAQNDDLNVFNLNSFLVDFYFRKYESSHAEIYRQLFSFLRSWKKYVDHHEQAKLFLSLLGPERNTIEGIKMFLRLRKCILKSLNQKILQELSLTHQDALTITHTLFSHNTEVKSYVTKKINELFISLKRKLINSAKVNGAVMCEFFMACGQRFTQMNVTNLFGDVSKTQKKSIGLKHEITPKKRQPLPEKRRFEDVGLFGENPQRSNDIKYNLSFSEEFASYYSPPIVCKEQELKEIDCNNQNQSNFVSNFEELENEWKLKNSQNQAPINLVRDSLKFFKKKDQQIDQKLTHSKKFNFQHHLNQSMNQSKQNILYPEGWQNFIKTNQITKRKLMGQAKSDEFQQIY